MKHSMYRAMVWLLHQPTVLDASLETKPPNWPELLIGSLQKGVATLEAKAGMMCILPAFTASRAVLG